MILFIKPGLPHANAFLDAGTYRKMTLPVLHGGQANRKICVQKEEYKSDTIYYLNPASSKHTPCNQSTYSSIIHISGYIVCVSHTH